MTFSLAPGLRPIGTSKEAMTPWTGHDERTRVSAAIGSELLRDAIQRTGQALAPAPKRDRLTFEEQLALVASGRARIVEWGGR
jgi:hypothetical protein